MRLIRKHFPKVFSDDVKNGDMTNLQVVNGTKGFMVDCNGALRFLDVKNYLAPGTSLKKVSDTVSYRLAKRFISI